jgi:peptidoglycan-associated lipoprotein
MKRCVSLVIAALTSGAVMVGCGSDPSPQPATPQAASPGATGTWGAPATAAAPQRDDMATPTSGSIHIDDKIVKACGNLPTPHFAFDSANLRSPAKDALDALATCFTTGPLKGKGLKLVGHADPRGDIDYNLGLGHKRAGSVVEYLSSKGVAKDQLDTSSKGEFEATGTDEEGWAQDRKVEIFLSE